MSKAFDDPEKEASFQIFLEHVPSDVGITLMILKGHLLIEEEINEFYSKSKR